MLTDQGLLSLLDVNFSHSFTRIVGEQRGCVPDGDKSYDVPFF